MSERPRRLPVRWNLLYVVTVSACLIALSIVMVTKYGGGLDKIILGGLITLMGSLAQPIGAVLNKLVDSGTKDHES